LTEGESSELKEFQGSFSNFGLIIYSFLHFGSIIDKRVLDAKKFKLLGVKNQFCLLFNGKMDGNC